MTSCQCGAHSILLLSMVLHLPFPHGIENQLHFDPDPSLRSFVLVLIKSWCRDKAEVMSGKWLCVIDQGGCYSYFIREFDVSKAFGLRVHANKIGVGGLFDCYLRPFYTVLP